MRKSEIEKKIDEMANADKTLTQMLMPAILGIVMCMVCLCACTWAWLTATPVTSGVSTITAGNFSTDKKINNMPIAATDNTVVLSLPGDYVVSLSSNSKVKGYVIVTVDGESWFSPQFVPDSTDTIEFHVHVGAEKANGVTISFLDRWGQVSSDDISLGNGTIIDKKAPVITMTTDPLVAGQISFAIEDDSEVQVTVTSLAATGTATVPTTVGENRTYQFTATKVGSYLIMATDIKGNSVTKTIEVIDNKPPTITMITDPLVVGQISFKVEDESGVQQVTVTTGATTVETTVGENGTYQFTATVGEYSITAIDNKGNSVTKEIAVVQSQTQSASTPGNGANTGSDPAPQP